MPKQQIVHCPNCGTLSHRIYTSNQQRTECQLCDYYLVTCVKTGNVIEWQAPGLHPDRLRQYSYRTFR